MSVSLRNEQIEGMQVRGEVIKSPYPGLIPYSADDAKLFFGRKTETRLVIANLYAARLTLFYGGSGVGKSSVLQAGVLHTLILNPGALGVYFNKWKGNPCAGLKAKIAEAATAAVGSDLTLDQTLPLDEYVARVSKNLKRRLFIILDQFEEYFLYHREDEEDEFFEEFPLAVRNNEAPVGFLISLREDALSLLDRFEGEIPALFDNYLRIKHLDLEGARSAIVEPLAVYNQQFSDGASRTSCESELVELILQDLSRKTREAEGFVTPRKTEQTAQITQPTAKDDLRIKAPYLQLVMTRLWTEATRTSPPTMGVATLRKLGGVEKIIDRHLDKSMRGLSWSQRRLATQVFLYLVTPSGTKKAYTGEELATLTGVSPQRVTKVLDRLSGSDIRILNRFETSIGQQNGSQHTNYEIYHDFLAQPILAWRAKQRFYQRLLIMQLFWILPAFIVFTLFLILPNERINLSDMIFNVIILTPLLSIPLVIGFLIGRGVERTR